MRGKLYLIETSHDVSPLREPPPEGVFFAYPEVDSPFKIFCPSLTVDADVREVRTSVVQSMYTADMYTKIYFSTLNSKYLLLVTYEGEGVGDA